MSARPLGAWLRRLMHLARDDWRLRDVVAVLSSGFVDRRRWGLSRGDLAAFARRARGNNLWAGLDALGRAVDGLRTDAEDPEEKRPGPRVAAGSRVGHVGRPGGSAGAAGAAGRDDGGACAPSRRSALRPAGPRGSPLQEGARRRRRARRAARPASGIGPYARGPGRRAGVLRVVPGAPRREVRRADGAAARARRRPARADAHPARPALRLRGDRWSGGGGVSGAEELPLPSRQRRRRGC